ncbi:hypothetical protein FQN54_007004 [Arachnomyces sp. PD_36]|nr:hypothetical protein FQN54_007004 [Arachnomyces sp. PD_36]
MDDTMNKMGDALLLRFKGINPLFSNARYRDLNVQNLCSGLAAAFLLYIILLVIYRLYLSPIAAFPGPKLAAATEWYELYYHLIKDGQFGRKVERMHEKYGPIVRISPWELSIRDSSFYNQIYVAGSTRRADMWARGRKRNGSQDSLHLSVPHGLHRQRRKHLEAFFSRQNIDCIEKVIADEAQLLDSRLQKFKGTGTAVHIDHAFTALTGDVIGRITCGTHPGFVEDVDFSPGWHELIIKTVLAGPSFRCFTWLNRLLQLVPCSILQRLYPKGTSNLMVGSMGAQYIEKIKEQIQNGNLDPSDSSKSVFHHLRTSDIPESEKSTARLQAESMIFLISGAVTSAHTLSMIVYHLLSNPHMEKRLREDLKDAMACYPAQNPLWSDLEKIPYLKACIKEALRLNGLVGNIARCSPGVEVQYKKWIIPRNVF